MKRQIIAFLAGLLAASFSLLAHAAWPERTINFVVPYAAGGLNDNEARITAKWLTKSFKKGVVVENRTGASGAIAADYVARARPDGYTLFFTALPTMVMVPHTQKVNYDPFKSFVPIATLDASYIAFAVNPEMLPTIKTFSDLAAYAKAKPNQLSFATGGVGVTGHLSMELLLKEAGLKMTHVPYRGSNPAVLAVLGGQVPIYVGTLSDVLQYYKKGQLRIIGVSSAKRLSAVPEVPTIAEQGYPTYKISTWNGLLAPAGTPKQVISKISAALETACRDPEFKASFQALGVDSECTTPAQFSRTLKSDYKMWGEAVVAAGVKQQQ